MAFIDLLVYAKVNAKSIQGKYLSGINIHSLHKKGDTVSIHSLGILRY